MSNFSIVPNIYWCSDCKTNVDLKIIKSDESVPEEEGGFPDFGVCEICNGTNWKAIIDTPSGEKET